MITGREPPGAVHAIRRDSLAERLARSPIGVVEAPGGYGKSLLLAQAYALTDRVPLVVELVVPTDASAMVASVARAARRRGLPDLADAMSAADPDQARRALVSYLDRDPTAPLPVFDDIHHADESAVRWLGQLVAELRTPILVAGRHVPGPIHAMATERDGVVLGPADLLYSDDELSRAVAQQLGRPATREETRSVEGAAGRWPAAVALAVAQLAAGRVLSTNADLAPIRVLVVELVRSQPADRHEALGRLAHLPLLSPTILEIVGGADLMRAVVDSGLPLIERADGWMELAGPVREVLGEYSRPTASQLADVAAEYARRGDLATAVTMFVDCSEFASLWQLLAAQPRAAIAAVGAPLLVIAAELADDATLAAGILGLVRAAQALEHADPALRAAWLERADRIAGPAGPERRALDAERARERLRQGDLTGSSDLARAVLAATPAQERLTRARAHYVVGVATIVSETATAGAVAVRELGMAGQLFRLAGERQWEALALMTEGFGVHLPAGSFALAEERIGASLALLGAADSQRGLTLTYHAESLMHLARYEDAVAALSEANAIGRRLVDERITGYACWTSMDVAGLRRDRAGVLAWMEEADRYPGDWFDAQAGAEYLCSCALALMRVEEPVMANERLTLAESRATSSRDDMVRLARARYEALVGDPANGLDLLQGLDKSPTLYPRDRWIQSLIRAACLRRLGDQAAADAEAQHALAVVAVMGDASRAERTEWQLLAKATGATGAALLTSPSFTVQLLGGFQVRSTGEHDVTPPEGHPATLVKLLALRRTLHVDAVIDALWPDADAATGRARVRNLLNRIRAACGPLVERDGDALVLGTDVEVDVVRFEDEAQLALAAPHEQRGGLARRALQRYTGELLPTDLYTDWAAVPRERHRRSYLALLDLVAADALARDDYDEALQLLDRAIALEPYDEGRYLKAANALVAQGRRLRAREMLERALAVAEDLGIVANPELEDTLAALT